jgi:hypothetical protein
LATRIAQAEPADAAGLLAGVLAEGGVLDAFRGLLGVAIDVVDNHTEATGEHGNPSVYGLWHILSLSADILDDQAADLHGSPQLLQVLTTLGTPAEGLPTDVPEQRRPQDWVAPAAVQEAPAALDAITSRLDAGTAPASAALLVGPVFDPDGGVLERLSELLASASRYAQQHGAETALWQDLGRAGQHLGDISGTLAGAAAGLAKLPATTGPARGQGKSPGLPAPAPSGTAGRRR